MVELKRLFEKGLIVLINEFEMPRYISFFESSYKDNLKHAKKNINEFPRWAIISSYYAMHDITKLLFVKKFRIKITSRVHETTIKVLRALIDSKKLIELMEEGYKEYLSLADELSEAKKERIKVQYYTGTKYLKRVYKKRAVWFFESVAVPYIKKVERLLK